ncbi:MAG: alkaline phosphatase PhoX, partial [Pyrinomonadaceae bacterium]
MALADDPRPNAYRAIGFGELVPTATKNTGETFLSLPKGFDYNVIGRVKGMMSDGRPTPAAHDGMWTFKVKDQLRIVRNHEVSHGSVPKEGAGIGTVNHY